MRRVPGLPPSAPQSGGRGHRRCLLPLLAGGLLLATLAGPRAAAAKPRTLPEANRCAAAQAGLPTDAELEASGAVVGDIRFRTIDIFDTSVPAEDTKLFRFANKLHRTTRPQVIARQVLVRAGDRYSRRVLDESERLLRMNDYLFEASICPVAYTDGRVDLEVTTRDVWTLRLGAGYSRSGGVNRFKFVVADDNLLGTGKSLAAERLADVDRTSTLVRYVDPAVLGSHWRAGASYADNSDGSRWQVFGELPFYQLDARKAYGLDVSETEQVDNVYDLGEIRRRFRENLNAVAAYYGWSGGLHDGWARRYRAGYTYEEHDFSEVRPGSRPPPPDHTEAYPWIGVDWEEDAYGTVRNLDQLFRVEDLFLGSRFGARIGYSAEGLGASANAVVYGGHFQGGRHWESGRTLLWEGVLDGRYRDHHAEDLLADLRLRFYQRDFGEQMLYVTLDLAAANRLDPETQLLIGGDSGLRGYPLRYQSGNRRVLFTIEQRVYTDWYPFRLVRVGGAAFFDIGRAWFPDDPIRPKEFGWLKDVGCGLRLASTRSGFGNVVHLDVAFPFDKPNEVARVQFVVSTHATF